MRNYSFPDPIYVTRPAMPSLESYTELMAKVWDAEWLTNDGALHNELEARVADHLGVEYLSLFCNGTLALMVALRLLGVTGGEVITTPFTFPATPHVLDWSGIEPVFCDIDPATATIDPAKIETLITSRTRAILGVHVYGHPCDVDALKDIGARNGLPVIYDAAHAFGVRLRGRPLCSYGDASALSFHATKLFSTGEGGALVMSSKEQKDTVWSLKNFGIVTEESVAMSGINGKMNEFQAAFGLLQLQQVDKEIARRLEIDRRYREILSEARGVLPFSVAPETEANGSYFPVLIDETECALSRDDFYNALKEYNIYARKYFYPLCSHYPCYADRPSAQPENLASAERIGRQILCLPIYGSLELETVNDIARLVVDLAQNGT